MMLIILAVLLIDLADGVIHRILVRCQSHIRIVIVRVGV